MRLKLDEQNHAVLQDGKPVYVHEDGKEVPFDAAQAVGKIASLNTLAQGAVGLAKAAAGIGHADKETTALRLAECAVCPALLQHPQDPEDGDVIHGIGFFDRCGICGCFVRAKTLLADQSCPLDKWQAVSR